MNKNIKYKILILSLSLEFLLITTFLFSKNNIKNIIDFMLFCSTLLTSVLGLFYGLIWSLVSSLFFVFLLGTYLMFNTIFNTPIEIAFENYYIWFLIIPIVAYTSGYLGNHTKDILSKLDFYTHNVGEYITIDMVTHFKNSKTFYIELKEEIDRAKRYENEFFSIVLIKIKYLNEFKSIYGLNQMNNLLGNIADKISSALRSSDKKYKVEHDTFALILPSTDLEGANNLKNRIKNDINLTTFNLENKNDKKIFTIECQASCNEYNDNLDTPIKIKKTLERELEYDV
ncbi:diguanylate cyclase domain-containing protein [Tepidibacter aestuarii]|uniref:diguanylate cyclase domain-containing protein n=1 Tax=Tepidibacter aestuarii TaxID=2925782 RepID=UPI0020BFADD7|nr:diguanylate cyclase [Tepidibacter aestuarii]CAH2214653.1 putative Diguanylate cyclase (GGDEF) domain-containing protein [Tepidibacter aestuarii]